MKAKTRRKIFYLLSLVVISILAERVVTYSVLAICKLIVWLSGAI